VIQELTTEQIGPVAPFTERNPNILYVAGSGLPPGSCPDHFGSNVSPCAFEIIRVENNPKPGEPDLNANRYVVGEDTTGRKFQGYETIGTNDQVAPHWLDWEDINKRFPTKRKS
jgi:hypothetical protein